jgi:hypothetical protein
MLTGHYGAAWLIKAAFPNASLPLLFIFTQTQDILVNLLGSVFHLDTIVVPDAPPNPYLKHISVVNAPYSHSVFSSVLVTCLMFAYFSVPKPRSRTSAPFATLPTHPATPYALAVISHLILDAIVHYPAFIDPCWPFVSGCPCISLGLWRYVYPSIAVETAVILVGRAAYIRSKQGYCCPGMSEASMLRGRIATFFTRALAAIMVLITVSLPYAPPPPDVDISLAVTNYIIFTLFTVLGWAIDAYWPQGGPAPSDGKDD